MARRRRRRGKKPSMDGGYLDALVPVGPAAKSDGDTSILKLLGDLEDEGRKGIASHMARASRNERYFHNILDVLDSSTPDGVNSNHATLNYFRNLIQTYSARFNQDRPSIHGFAKHAEGTDVNAAEVANALIEYQYDIQDFDQKTWWWVTYAQLHSCAAIKCVWDPDGGDLVSAPQVDEVTGEPLLDEDGMVLMENLGFEGEISWELLTLFDYYYGGGDSVDEADWCVCVSYLNKYEAADLLHEYTGKWLEMNEESYDPSIGEKTQGVKMSEIWYPPCPRIPDGLYALVVGGHVANFQEYPYQHGKIPIAELKINPIRGSRFATSHADDAIPIQQMINELEEMKHEITRAYGFPKGIGVEGTTEAMEYGPQHIQVAKLEEVSQGFRWIDPPKIPDIIFGQQQDSIEKMYDVFGLNEVLAGKDNVKSGTSAKQIAYLNNLDSQKMAGVLRNFETALKRLLKMTFSASRQYMTGDRLMHIVGPDSEVIVQGFQAADLNGVDIILEPASGTERFRAQAAAEAEEDLQQGKIDPRAGMERAQTGLNETMGDANQRGAAQQLVQMALQGQQVQPDPRIQPKVAIDVIDRFLAGAPPAAKAPLQQLRQAYQQMLAPQGGPPAPGQQQAGPPQPRPSQGVKRPSPVPASIQMMPGDFRGRP